MKRPAQVQAWINRKRSKFIWKRNETSTRCFATIANLLQEHLGALPIEETSFYTQTYLPRQFHQEGDWKGVPFDRSESAQAFGQEAHAGTIDKPTTKVVW